MREGDEHEERERWGVGSWGNGVVRKERCGKRGEKGGERGEGVGGGERRSGQGRGMRDEMIDRREEERGGRENE